MTGSNDRSFNVWRLSGALCDFNNDLRPTSEATVDWRIQGIPLQIESFRHFKRLTKLYENFIPCKCVVRNSMPFLEKI